MTTSLELSKELDNRGIRLETYFIFKYEGNQSWLPCRKVDIHEGDIDYLPRPMLHELLEVMPDHVKKDDTTYTPALYFGDFTSTGREYWFGYEALPPKSGAIGVMENQDNPVNAVVRCLIYLIDNKYVSVEGGKVCLDK